jgi:3-methyladenine DNA glycosylase Tag
MTMRVFEAGMSWKVVEAKWPGIQEAFHGFDPERVANMSPSDVELVANDPGVIRNWNFLWSVDEPVPPYQEWAATHLSAEERERWEEPS